MADRIVRAISTDGMVQAAAICSRGLTERARQIHKTLPVATAALDNVSANAPDESTKMKLASLTAPYICLDGLNEKGVSIAVLTLDSDPVHQSTGKYDLCDGHGIYDQCKTCMHLSCSGYYSWNIVIPDHEPCDKIFPAGISKVR